MTDINTHQKYDNDEKIVGNVTREGTLEVRGSLELHGNVEGSVIVKNGDCIINGNIESKAAILVMDGRSLQIRGTIAPDAQIFHLCSEGKLLVTPSSAENFAKAMGYQIAFFNTISIKGESMLELDVQNSTKGKGQFFSFIDRARPLVPALNFEAAENLAKTHGFFEPSFRTVNIDGQSMWELIPEESRKGVSGRINLSIDCAVSREPGGIAMLGGKPGDAARFAEMFKRAKETALVSSAATQERASTAELPTDCAIRMESAETTRAPLPQPQSVNTSRSSIPQDRHLFADIRDRMSGVPDGQPVEMCLTNGRPVTVVRNGSIGVQSHNGGRVNIGGAYAPHGIAIMGRQGIFSNPAPSKETPDAHVEQTPRQ